MLLLPLLAFLQGAVYVVIGEGTPYPFFSSINREGIVPNPFLGAFQPVISDIRQSFDKVVPKDYIGAANKPNFPFVNNWAEYIKKIPSEKVLPNDLSFPKWNFEVGLRNDSNLAKDQSSSFKPSGLSFSEWSIQVSKNGHSVIKRFAHDYIDRVQSSKELCKAFQVQGFNTKSLSAFFYNYILKSHLSIGNPDAEISAQFVGLAVSVNFDKIVKKKDSLLRILVYFTSNYLFYRGYLNESNVASVSQQYFSYTKRRINSVEEPDPKENIKAVCDAHSDFLGSLDLISNKYEVNMMAGVFASQLYA